MPSQPFRQGGSSLKAACHRQAHNGLPQNRCYFTITCPARERWIIQRRLDSFAAWYNTHRPHSALGIRTPEEAFTGKVLRATTEEFIPARRNARDGPNIHIEVARRNCRHDRRLPVVEITVRKAA
ncbi:MAG: integrase core domain-containing protein [Phycisphaerae bacterium]